MVYALPGANDVVPSQRANASPSPGKSVPSKQSTRPSVLVKFVNVT